MNTTNNNRIYGIIRNMFQQISIESYSVYLDTVEVNMDSFGMTQTEKNFITIFKELVKTTTAYYVIHNIHRVRDNMNIYRKCAKNALKSKEYREFLDLQQSLSDSIEVFRVSHESIESAKIREIISLDIHFN